MMAERPLGPLSKFTQPFFKHPLKLERNGHSSASADTTNNAIQAATVTARAILACSAKEGVSVSHCHFYQLVILNTLLAKLKLRCRELIAAAAPAGAPATGASAVSAMNKNITPLNMLLYISSTNSSSPAAVQVALQALYASRM